MRSDLDPSTFRRLLPALRDIYVAAYRALPEYSYRDPAQVVAYLEWLFAGEPRGFFVAHGGDGPDSPIAFAAVHGARSDRAGRVSAELQELVVDPPWQGKGIGVALLGQAIAYSRSLQRHDLTLWVGEHNELAERLYRRFGFRTVSRHRRWLRMVLALDGAGQLRPPLDQSA